MIEQILQRYSGSADSTLGIWLQQFPDKNPEFWFYTLEDESRIIKVAGETRIAAGRYELKLKKIVTPMTERYRHRFSWFKWHVEVCDVPGFTNVYVHIGNKDDDTDACILVGDGANNNRIADGYIGPSAPAYQRWYQFIVPELEKGERAFLNIRDESWLA